MQGIWGKKKNPIQMSVGFSVFFRVPPCVASFVLCDLFCCFGGNFPFAQSLCDNANIFGAATVITAEVPRA